MNLVDFLIFAHMAPEYEEMIKQKKSELDYDIITLIDEQAVLVRDEEMEILKK